MWLNQEPGAQEKEIQGVQRQEGTSEACGAGELQARGGCHCVTHRTFISMRTYKPKSQEFYQFSAVRQCL